MSSKMCCVPGCSVKAMDGIPLQRFPNPEKEIERFRTWVLKIGSDLIQLDNLYVYNNRRVCRQHFEEKWLYPKGRLCQLAIPTLNLKGGTQLVHTLTSPSLQNQSGCSALPTTLTQSTIQNTIPVTPALPMEVEYHPQSIPATSSMQTQTQGIKFTGPEIEMRNTITKLKNIIKSMKTKLKRQEKANNSFKKRLSIAKEAVKTNKLDVLTKKLTKPAKAFVEMQISEAGKHNKGRRFTETQKIYALSLYKSSPKAYRVLSEICILPNRKSLQNLLQKISIKPGINEIMFENLKKRVQKMPEHHKYCSLIFDEMAIAAHLDLNTKDGTISGFVDDGKTKRAELADHVLVIMVRGIIKKYKQPVHFSFCAGTTKTTTIKTIIKDVVEQVTECGLKVVALVCDQGATNMAAINSLMNDTRERYLKRNKEYTGGFIEIMKNKIFPIYDPPHLMKGIRNNLLNKNLCYEANGKKCVAKWQHIIDLYSRNPGYKGVKLFPKLTHHHVMPHMIPKMRVKHCTQVFSSTIGVAMGFMAGSRLPQEAEDTADILLFFDKLFDSVNGSYSQIKQGKIYRTAVTPTSPHHKLWQDSLAVLKSMKYVNNDGKTSIVPSLSSWIKTIEGFKLLCKHLHKLGQSSLLLRNLNQDPLENFFGGIRAHGHSNIMPTAAGFQAAYKTLLINNLSSKHSVGANCEKDESTCLQNLRFYLKGHRQELSTNNEFVLSEEHMCIEINSENILISDLPHDVEKCAAIGYCSGWLVRAAKKNVYKGCDVCTSQLQSEEKQSFHEFIKISEYSDKGWLCYPTREAFDIFYQTEAIIMEVLKTHSNINNVIEYLKLVVTINVNYGFLTCASHKEQLVEFLIHKNVIFCVNNWCNEINKILNGKITNHDVSDPVKVAAQNHFLKNKTRKRKRETGLEVNV